MAYAGERGPRWQASYLLLVTLALPGCHRAFTCEQDDQCRLDGVDGACEASGHCSFPDPGCPSRRRYGEHASASLAGTCVEPADAASSSGTSAGMGSGSGTTAGSSAGSSAEGPAADPDFDPCNGLLESGPVVATADGQIIEGLRITAHDGPGIDVTGHTGVVIRGCEIHHHGGPGITFRAAHDLTIEDVAIVHDGAPEAGPHLDGSQVNLDGRDSTGVVISRVRASQGASGIELQATPGAQLSQLEVHDVRGPGAAACVRLFDSDDAVLEDFSCENPLDTGRPGDLVAIDESSDVIVRRGLLDGHNAEYGYGVRFIQIQGQHSGGLVEDVDGVRMTNGAFSCFGYGTQITFRRTRARDNICEILSVPIEGCEKPGPSGGCVPNSNGVSWAASLTSSAIVIEDSSYFALCDDPAWPLEVLTIGPGDLVEEDFEPRPPIRLELCWE